MFDFAWYRNWMKIFTLYFKHCSSDYSADDAAVHTHSNSIDIIEDNLQCEFGKTQSWSKENNMQGHLKKPTCILVGTKTRVNESRLLNIQADRVSIQTVSKQKLLGIYIDENLTWSLHIDHLCSLISSKNSLLGQLATHIPTHAQKLFLLGVYPSLHRQRHCRLGCNL